ncbi:hypothetical protein [Pseudobdellovibrio exovorus]|uniref:Uncharacterized protein n=1 Tax=Pseudobdellovibrio exovorus JSS TaxID=1184267 RepID=M4VCV2_9BACT|nr:hypothetical protein [Pseudobdellovibrio exovorus]AGH95866.1 hypothetical protein A11Q_1650 [Pseudobdellovibrio exovorus JSS]
MADSIQSKRNQQATYLRQIQQERASKRRELLEAQKEDMKSVRDYYADQNKRLDQDTAAAVNHIKEESRIMASEEKAQRVAKAQAEMERKNTERATRLQAQHEANAEVDKLKKKASEIKS